MTSNIWTFIVGDFWFFTPCMHVLRCGDIQATGCISYKPHFEDTPIFTINTIITISETFAKDLRRITL